MVLSYMDPKYVITQKLIEKSGVYSCGEVLLRFVTARRAIQDNKNLEEWSQGIHGIRIMTTQTSGP